MILLIDIGNTRVKWARLEQGRLSEQSALPHADLGADQLREALANPMQRPERILMSNVAGARVAQLVSDSVAGAWSAAVEVVHASAAAGGVRNGYRDPARLGVDRWLAVIGAYALERSDAIVVSVGTAMTIDAVDASGAHRGGVIVPGPDLMVSSLFSNTSDIAYRARDGVSSMGLFADNTLGAVEQGALHALAALIERALAVFEHEVGRAPALILTGGASARVAAAVRCPHREMPDLVLRGLAVLAQESR
jgi:type III pantothenate kinase